MRFPGLGDEPKTLHDFRGLRLQMRCHSRRNILEAQFSQSARRQNILDLPVSDISTGTQEDSLLFAAICNIISGEVELRPFGIRLPVSGDEVRRA